MEDFAKTITPISIEEELKNSYLDYAMSVIVGRALPDVRDGLKPVHRRVLFAMHELNNYWNKPYKKSARIVGDVIGKYHPHGDSAVYDTIVRMAQTFSLRYMLIDGQGNFGSIDGDSPAAMRYTEIRMSKIVHDILGDLDKDTVNFVLNYDGSELIPEVMPTKVPNLLINGSSGIAVGMATNIPPHNLREVINGCLAYIEDKNITVKKLMEYIPGPDFPTAAVINGRYGIEEAYSTGRGKIYIRGKSKIEINKKTGHRTIIIYELPYQVNKSRLIEKIAELTKEKRIEGIIGLRDESDKDGMRIIIEIKHDVIYEAILNKLYSLTSLQTSFGINMVALHHGQPKTMTLKEILDAFICHRREVIIRRTNFELRKTRERAHILEGLIIALFNINDVISLIRQLSNVKTAKKSLIEKSWSLPLNNNTVMYTINNSIMYKKYFNQQVNILNNKYFFTKEQVQAILDLRLHKLTILENNELINEYEILLNKIIEFVHILKNSKRLMEVICEELKLIYNQFGDERRTEITNNIPNINIEDLIDKKDVVVTLSYQGYVKYQPLKDYEAQHRGGKGKSAAYIKEKDLIDILRIANTHDTILCFSSLGRLYWMKVYNLPEATRSARGRPITNLLPLETNERITAILPEYKYIKDFNILMATANGIVKKTSLKEFSNTRNTGIIAIKLRKNDELIGVALTSGNNEVMLFSSAGKVVRFSETTIRAMGRTTFGVRGIKLAKDDRVVSLIVPRDDGEILTVTQNGYGKRTLNKEYSPVKSRSRQGVISIKVTKRNGSVIGAVQVIESDQIIMITNAGTLVRIRVSEISIVGRNTQGVILIRTVDNEKVVALQRISKSLE